MFSSLWGWTTKCWTVIWKQETGMNDKNSIADRQHCDKLFSYHNYVSFFYHSCICYRCQFKVFFLTNCLPHCVCNKSKLNFPVNWDKNIYNFPKMYTVDSKKFRPLADLNIILEFIIENEVYEVQYSIRCHCRNKNQSFAKCTLFLICEIDYCHAHCLLIKKGCMTFSY